MPDAFNNLRDVWLKQLDELERIFEHPETPKKNSTGLMKQWGALMVEASHSAFEQQQMGDYQWPSKYEGMEDPFINIAGALKDFDSGKRKPSPVWFDRRPALIGLGGKASGLYASITFNVPGEREVEVGSNKPYARLHQEGGKQRVSLSEDGYKRARDWMFTKKGKPTKDGGPYIKNFWPSVFRRGINQKIARRPFLGITEQVSEDMIRSAREYFTKEAGGDVSIPVSA